MLAQIESIGDDNCQGCQTENCVHCLAIAFLISDGTGSLPSVADLGSAWLV